MIQNLGDMAKAVLRGKLIEIQSQLRKEKKLQINNLILHVKQLEKEKQTQPKVNGRKEIIKTRAEVKEIETKKTIANINETKSWFFEKIDKIYKSLINLQPNSSRKKGRGLRSITLEMKREKLQHTPQKYKGL